MANTNKRMITNALRWQNFEDVMYAFFDLGRLLHMKDSKMYQTEIRHMRKYGVIALVIIIEQFCREMVKVQTEKTPAKASFRGYSQDSTEESDEFDNFQNMPKITKTLAKYGITGIFAGDNGAEMRQIIESLIYVRHDAVHTVAHTMFDVLKGYDVTEALFRRILDLSVLENSSSIDIARATYEINNGSRDYGEKIMRDVINMEEKSSNILYNKSIACNKLEMYGFAVNYLKTLTVTEPNDYEALIQFGLSFDGLDERDGAIKCYKQVLQLRPDNMIALTNMCLLLADLGQKAESDSYLEKIQAIKSKDPLDLFYKGLILERLEYYEGALECFEEALVVKPGDPHILFTKGSALVNMEKDEDALECFDAVLEIWHGNTQALLAKAATLNNLGRYKESAECSRQAEPGTGRR